MKNLLRQIWEGWKKIALRIGRFNSMVLIGLVYFTGIALTAIGMKLCRFDPLHRVPKPKKPVGWLDAEPHPATLERCREQF
jgi:hypothetical protein